MDAVKLKVPYVAVGVTFFFLFLLWEFLSRTNSHLLFVLPAPSHILQAGIERWDRLLYHSWITCKEMGGGFILAFIFAFPMAWGMYLWKSVSLVLQPVFIAIQCIPMFTLAPLMVFWFGWSFTAIVIPTALMIFFPLTISIYQGLRTTPQNQLDFFRVNKATPWQTFTKLQLPWAMPSILAGCRISAAISGIGAVAGEWAGAQAGLGVLMLESRRATDLEMAFAALFCLTLISLILYSLTVLFEKNLSRYRTTKETALASLALFAFIFSSCSVSPEPASKTQVRLILDWLPNPNHVPLYAGIREKIFEKHGIDLEIIKINDPGETVSFVNSGRADLGLYYMPETYLANIKKPVLSVVGFLIKEPLNAIIYRKELGIKNLSDLNGKRLGYSVGGFGLFFVNTLLNDAKIHLQEMYNVNFDLVSTLGTKKVDAVYGAYWNIETEHLKSLGIETDYFPLKEMGHPLYYELIFVTKIHSIYDQPEFKSRFQKALQESIDYAVAYPNDAFEAYMHHNPDKRNKTFPWEKAAWLKTLPVLAVDQVNDEAVWQRFDEWIKSH